MGQRADALAARFEQAVADLAKTVEACSDTQWAAACSAEGWTVAQTAQHVSGQFPLEMEFITAAAEGKPHAGLQLGRHQRQERRPRREECIRDARPTC